MTILEKSHIQDINIIKKKHYKLIIASIVILILIGLASVVTQYNHLEGIASIPIGFSWLLSNMLFTSATLSNLPKVLSLLWDTILISFISSVVAAIFAVVFAILGSKVMAVNRFFMYTAKVIASISRNIPVVAWALILVVSFGTNAATGFLALFFTSFGFLVRAFIETIDEMSLDTIEALRATGASYTHIVVKAVLTESLPQMFSWVLFMIETNIRNATLIGILTGTGIGYLFDLYYKQLDYQMISLITLAIVFAVLIIEFISNYIRREILR